MSETVIWGVILGSFAGVGYAVWQGNDLRRQRYAKSRKWLERLVPRTSVRLLSLASLWWLAFQFAAVDKKWLTGAFLVTYSAGLVWQLKGFMLERGRQ